MPSVNLGITSLPFLNRTSCGTLKLPPFDFFLKDGCFDCPLKKRLKAVSKFLIADCRDWAFISLSHSNSFLMSGNCFCSSKRFILVSLSLQAACFFSKKKLYTNLQQPICLLSSTVCAAVGYSLYLNAFNMMLRYGICRNQQNYC